MWKRTEGPATSRDRSIVAAATLALVALLGTLTVAGCGGSDTPTDDAPPVPETPALADPPPDGAAAVATITAADLTGRVGIIAHDSMMGRSTPSPELVKTAGYLAAELEGLGLRPDGTDERDECLAQGLAEASCPYVQWFFAQPVDTVRTLNVIARLPGSDPVLRGEYLVIGAHFDHVGIRAAVAGDSIYNGADDNGSGTAGVLELAEAFASLATPPRRSILFVLFSGEERGLLGSRYYVGSQEAPIGHVAAMINLDMIGRNWPDRVAAVYQLDSDIFERAVRVADAHPELNMTLLTDPWPGENLVNRSDQAPFIPYGVPVLFLTSGLHEDYHQATDEADRLDYEKTARLVRLIFWIGWEFAEASRAAGILPVAEPSSADWQYLADAVRCRHHLSDTASRYLDPVASRGFVIDPQAGQGYVWQREPVRDGQRLLFVGGPPRSGTTLVQNVLDSHPKILGTPEFLHLPGILQLRSSLLASVDRGFLEFFCDRPDVDQATYEFIERMLGPVLESSDAAYVSEKTPSNVLVFPNIQDLLPDARFVFVIRDPRAIVASMMRIGRRARAKGVRTLRYVHDVQQAVRVVRQHLAAGFAFADREPDRCITVRYEELTTRPAEVTRELCEFLNLEWSEAMLYPERFVHPGELALTREGLWYEPAEFKRALSADRNESWRQELYAGQQILVTNAFRDCSSLLRAGYDLELDHLRGVRGLAARLSWGGSGVLRRAKRTMTPS